MNERRNDDDVIDALPMQLQRGARWAAAMVVMVMVWSSKLPTCARTTTNLQQCDGEVQRCMHNLCTICTLYLCTRMSTVHRARSPRIGVRDGQTNVKKIMRTYDVCLDHRSEASERGRAVWL